MESSEEKICVQVFVDLQCIQDLPETVGVLQGTRFVSCLRSGAGQDDVVRGKLYALRVAENLGHRLHCPQSFGLALLELIDEVSDVCGRLELEADDDFNLLVLEA